MRKHVMKAIARKEAKAVARAETQRKALAKPNWQKQFKKAMFCNKGFDKIMNLIGRGIAVQRVKNAQAGLYA